MTIDEFLAIEVMGWQRKKGRHDAYGPILHSHYIDPANKDFWLDAHGWSPSTNIEQAMMCLRKCEHCEINGSDSRGWYVYVELPNSGDLYGECVTTECDTLEESISLACARAAGWSDDDEH